MDTGRPIRRRGPGSRGGGSGPAQARARARSEHTGEHKIVRIPVAAGSVPERLILRDGTVVVLRPIRPDDRRMLSEMHEGLSDDSRYRRFLHVHPVLGDKELSYLTDIDHHDHEALIALEDEDGPIIGVVRYVRIGDDEAEPAMLITDRFHGRGLCSQMLEQLVVRAWSEGIRRFRAPVLAGNTAAMHSLDRLGRPVHHQIGSEVEVEVELREPEHPLQPGTRTRPDRPQRGRRRLTSPESWSDEFSPRRDRTPDDLLADVVVCGVTVGGDSRKTVEQAAGLAAALDHELWIVGGRRNEKFEDVRDALERLAEPLRAQGLEVKTTVRRATPAAAMVAVAAEERARFVVLGGSRRDAGPIALTGAVSDTVARQAPCDVLVVR